MKKKLFFFILIFSLLVVQVTFSSYEQIRSLSLGMEVSGRLDDDELYEDQYRLRLHLPRGVYRLILTKVAGGFPAVNFSSDSLEEDIYLSSFQDPVFTLTLPSGEYRVTVENEEEIAILAYKLKLKLIGPWNDGMEWEPNEEPNQNIPPGKKIQGVILGDDEDNYRFTVLPGHPPAYDFILKTDSQESLLFKVGDGDENEEQCQIGMKIQDGYIIRGLALDNDQYVVSISFNPMAIMSQMNKGNLMQMKFPTVSYTLEVMPNIRPFCKLVSEDQAYMSAFEVKSDDDISEIEIREKVSPRKQIELDLYEFNLNHLKLFSAKNPFLNLSMLKEKSPEQFPKFQAELVKISEEVLTTFLNSIKEDPHIKNACQSTIKRFGSMSPKQAKAFSGLWPEWSDVPDEWAKEILDGYATRMLKKVVLDSEWILSASLISTSGLLVASTKIPFQLWQGERGIWKRLIGYRKQRVSMFPIFDEHLKRWTMGTAFLIKDSECAIGTLVVHTVIGK